jgi:hypothetical protein
MHEQRNFIQVDSAFAGLETGRVIGSLGVSWVFDGVKQIRDYLVGFKIEVFGD